MRVITLVVLMMILASLQVEAKTAAGFYKRFQVIRDQNGKLIGIRDRTLPVKFEVRPYVEMVKNELKHEQALMNGANALNYEQSVRDLLAEDGPAILDDVQYNSYVDHVVYSLKELASLNIEAIFEHGVFKDIAAQYEGKLTNAIMLLDPTMIAVVDNPTYFYTKNVTYKAVTWALDFAKKRLSSIPILNTISYVIVKVEKKITERREFHQNMLLHYLENFKEEELGLTHEEVNLIWSSIYESRIPWYAFWESKSARSNWDKYGVNNFYLNYRAASATIRNSSTIYTEVDNRINFAFQNVTYKGDKVAVNLFDNEGIFQNHPAVAYNYSKPTQVVRKRVMLSLAELGLSFVPVGQGIKNNVETFIKSYYETQRITEGALYGYFESVSDTKAMNQVKLQYLNPFDISL